MPVHESIHPEITGRLGKPRRPGGEGGPEYSGGGEGGGGYSPFSREVTRLRAKEEDFRRNGGKSISSSRVSPVPVPLDINSARSSSRVELMVSIVGKPVASLLLERNATVTICHSHTIDLPKIARSADILVTAIGKPNFVTADMVKNNAVVIDVGINRVDDKLVGDVDYDSVLKKAFLVTPVPGGVGPMTIAMLMANTLQSFKNSLP